LIELLEMKMRLLYLDRLNALYENHTLTDNYNIYSIYNYNICLYLPLD